MLDSAPDMIAGIARQKLDALKAREAKAYGKARPKTRAALEKGASHYLDGVPMHWMKDWPMPFAMLVKSAKGARSRVAVPPRSPRRRRQVRRPRPTVVRPIQAGRVLGLAPRSR